MDKVHNYDLSIFADKLAEIKSAMLLLNVYIQKRDALNRIELTKKGIANVLNKTPRTVANWILKLAKNGAIKYQYSGSTRLNPFFYFDGTQEEYAQAITEWENFQNNIKAS